MNATGNSRQPALFLGHGNPLHALADNRYTRSWRRLGATLPRPAAILAVSAHWLSDGWAVTAMTAPRTIHDFGGFPPALFEVRYPAPGSPALASRVQALLAPEPVAADHAWGLDHGVWSLLAHMYPAADVPVAQLSLDRKLSAAAQFELGRKLAPLRDEGVMILGSGNVVHNLGLLRWDDPDFAYAWATRFEQSVKRQILRNEPEPLIDYLALDPEAPLAVPTAEHYLPLLTVLGARLGDDAVSFPVEGIDMGSLSMLSALVGAAPD
jgi:4,5-DOPA dioxygenase extradiol